MENGHNEFLPLNQIRIHWFISLLHDIYNVEIHCFDDTRQKAHGVIVFIRVQNYNEVSVYVVASKIRIAPVKKITLSHLELVRAIFAAGLESRVESVIDSKK